MRFQPVSRGLHAGVLLGGGEHDGEAETVERLHEIDDFDRSGIPVRLRPVMVDDEREATAGRGLGVERRPLRPGAKDAAHDPPHRGAFQSAHPLA